MAVIQISKMQVRRGQTALTGFPQLSSGELGWSIDTQELYIGNGSVDEGAPAVGNTQLITEHNINNFFKYAENAYQYKDDARARVRSIQSKLDDFITLNDLVDISTTTYHTEAIQTAINLVSERGTPLVIPENNYIITGTIYIPSKVELRGAGPEKTVITNISTASTFQTIDSNNLTFSDGSYANAGAPRNIRINGITFVNSSSNALPILQLDCVSDTSIEGCEFIGDIAATAVTSTMVTAINFRDVSGYPSNKTDNVVIENCIFYKLGTAVKSDYDIANVLIKDNKFYTLDEGITLGKTLTGITPQQYGPQHVNIVHNRFDTVNKQAIYAGSTSTTYYTDINSTDNYFYRVGNFGEGDGVSNQRHEVIRFNSFGNYSRGDTFDRLNLLNLGTSYLASNSTATAKSIVAGPVTLTSKGPQVFNITGSGSSVPMFVFPRSTFQYNNNLNNQIITLEYTINKPAVPMVRKGTLDVVVSGSSATVTDHFSTNNDIEGDKVTFTADVDATRNLVIVKQNNQSAYLGNIIYTYTVRQ